MAGDAAAAAVAEETGGQGLEVRSGYNLARTYGCAAVLRMRAYTAVRG